MSHTSRTRQTGHCSSCSNNGRNQKSLADQHWPPSAVTTRRNRSVMVTTIFVAAILGLITPINAGLLKSDKPKKLNLLLHYHNKLYEVDDNDVAKELTYKEETERLPNRPNWVTKYSIFRYPFKNRYDILLPIIVGFGANKIMKKLNVIKSKKSLKHVEETSTTVATTKQPIQLLNILTSQLFLDTIPWFFMLLFMLFVVVHFYLINRTLIDQFFANLLNINAKPSNSKIVPNKAHNQFRKHSHTIQKMKPNNASSSRKSSRLKTKKIKFNESSTSIIVPSVDDKEQTTTTSSRISFQNKTKNGPIKANE